MRLRERGLSVAKKAIAKKSGQKAVPKAAKTAQPKKSASAPRPAKNAESRSSGSPVAKKTTSRPVAKPTKVTTAKPLAAKKAEPAKETSVTKKVVVAKVAASEVQKAQPAGPKAVPSAKPHGNNRPVSSKPGLDGGVKRRPAPDGSAPVRPSKPIRIDRTPMAADFPAEIPPTYLTPAELEEFREMLLEKRRELIGDVANLEDGAIRSGGSHSASGLSSMPIHMADIGSDTWEQELTLGLIENERGLLREIDEALERIKDGTYGMCLATGKPITKARLRAKPWAKHCIEYARKRELGLV